MTLILGFKAYYGVEFHLTSGIVEGKSKFKIQTDRVHISKALHFLCSVYSTLDGSFSCG